MSNNLYCFVKDGNIVSGPDSLPTGYKNISNFDSFEISNPEILADLSWAGGENEGYWVTNVEEKPAYSSSVEKLSASLSIDTETKTCNVSYTIVPLSSEELASNVTQNKQTEYDIKVAAGYAIPDTNIVLGIGDKDRIQWNQFLSLLNEMISLGQVTSDTIVKIVDVNGDTHDFTVIQAKQILAGLGYYYYTVWLANNSN